MELFNKVLQYLQTNPTLASLLTIAGLGAFIKLILVPVIKLVCQKLGYDITGTKTVLIVYLSSILTVVVVTALTHSPWNIGLLLLLAWQSTKDAIGLQESITAIKRPERMQ